VDGSLIRFLISKSNACWIVVGIGLPLVSGSSKVKRPTEIAMPAKIMNGVAALIVRPCALLTWSKNRQHSDQKTFSLNTVCAMNGAAIPPMRAPRDVIPIIVLLDEVGNSSVVNV